VAVGLRRPAGDREDRLDPVRWPGTLRRAALARGGLVAALLVAAAGVLYAGSPAARCDAGSAPAGTSASAGVSAGAPASHSASGLPGAAPFPEGSASRGPDPAADAGGPAVSPDASPVGGLPAAGAGPQPDHPTPPIGTVGVAVTLAEPAALGVLRPGDRVDLLAVAPSGSATVAANALVVATPGSADGGAGLYLAMDPRQARRVVAQPPEARLAVIVRP
jgi:hypothetical protein